MEQALIANNTNNYFGWRKTFTADDRLSSTTRLVMHTIHRYMDVKTLEAYPSRSTLAEDTGLSIKSISKHTVAVEKLGWLKKIPINLIKKRTKNTPPMKYKRLCKKYF